MKPFLAFFQILSILLVVSCGRTTQPEIKFKQLSALPDTLVAKNSGESTGPKRAKAFRLNKLNFKKLQSGKFLPQLGNAKIVSVPGRPRIPMLSYVFSVPKGKKARLNLEKPELEVTEEKIELSKGEKPFVWGRKTIEFKETEVLDYFPGKLFESHQIGNTVHVSLFPMQVETKTGKVLRLIGGSWSLRLEQSREKKKWARYKPALIITSEKLLAGAKALQTFHKEFFKVETELATVESIAKDSSPVDEEELPEGYKTPEEFEGIVKGYDFLTAKKIISFLRKRADEDPEFKYVVLMGNSENIPPSYYLLDKQAFDQKTTGVTDQCYGAGKLCLEPRLAVGRLPFSTNEQVSKYLNKAKKWLRNQEQAENELALYGGKAFEGSPFYIGELGTLVTVNRESADWKSTRKHFQTEGSFSRFELKKLASGEEKSSLVYYLDHGLGNRLFAGDEFISANDILSMESKEDALPPLVVSVSCINAAFDEELLVDGSMTEREQWGSVSVGTALLRSDAGAIAYLGSTREGLGSPETEVDENGNVEVLGTTHALQLLDGFVENYRIGKGQNLGDLEIETLQQYSLTQGNDMSEFSHRWTYWTTELLGDPLLPVIRKSRGERGYPAAKSVFEHFDNSKGLPWFVVNEKRESLSEFPISKAEGPVTAKVFELNSDGGGLFREKLIKSVNLKGGRSATIPFDLKWELASDKQYMIKLINDEGIPRERHILFSTSEEIK